jgi:hypothetical protein
MVKATNNRTVEITITTGMTYPVVFKSSLRNGDWDSKLVFFLLTVESKWIYYPVNWNYVHPGLLTWNNFSGNYPVLFDLQVTSSAV